MSEQISFLFHNHRKRSSGKWSFLFRKPANWFLLLDYLRVEVMLVFSLYKCYSRLSTVFRVSITFLHGSGAETRTALCSKMSFQEGLYSKQPLKTECFLPEQRADMLAVQYKRSKFPKFKDLFLKCNPHMCSIHLGSSALPPWDLKTRKNWPMLPMLLAVLWVISPSSLTQESYVISQHSWNYGRLTIVI